MTLHLPLISLGNQQICAKVENGTKIESATCIMHALIIPIQQSYTMTDWNEWGLIDQTMMRKAPILPISSCFGENFQLSIGMN